MIELGELRELQHGDRITVKVGKSYYDVWFESYHPNLGLTPGYRLVTRCESYPHLWRFFDSTQCDMGVRETVAESTRPFPDW